jgi:tryptophan halogenase
MNKKIVIVGGGTAGWMTAAYLAKYQGGKNITVIESDKISKIGVGESVTPHVASFFDEIGISVHDWMIKTGAIYKYANKFINWKDGKGESEYFSFNYTVPEINLFKDITLNRSKDDFTDSVTDNRSIDYLAYICQNNDYKKFDRYFNPQFHYMEKNTSPFIGEESLLNQPFSSSQHINAELASEYIKDEIAIPQGVTHIIGKVETIINDSDFVKKIILDTGLEITGDLFIDCSGFHKAIIKKLGWEEKYYNNHNIDSAWVCQTEYEDQDQEMVNYTQSIAEPYGWRFKIGIYHRMGNGYCYSSKHIDDENAKDYFLSQIKNKIVEPRLIKWKPSRLKKFGSGNVAAIGLSCGFIEPLEANALYIIISSIRRLNNVLSQDRLDFSIYNEKMAYTIDDIADFILVHYTLSSRNDTEFWKDMRSFGEKLNHKDLVIKKIIEPKNSMKAATEGYTMFPDYMWAQLAVSWNINLPYKNLDPIALELAKMHFETSEKKHNIISSNVEKSAKWHREIIFKNLSISDWVKKYIEK